MSFQGRNLFSVWMFDPPRYWLKLWNIQKHLKHSKRRLVCEGKWFFPVSNCVDVWEILLRGVKQQQRATYLFGEGLFNWLICLMDIATGGMWSHHDVRFQTSGGPQFLIHKVHQISIIILKLWNASKVEIIPKNGHFRNEEACVWGGRLHPTYIAIVAFTFGVSKCHRFFPHFSSWAIGVCFFCRALKNWWRADVCRWWWEVWMCFFPLAPFETMGFEGLNQLIRKLWKMANIVVGHLGLEYTSLCSD